MIAFIVNEDRNSALPLERCKFDVMLLPPEEDERGTFQIVASDVTWDKRDYMVVKTYYDDVKEFSPSIAFELALESIAKQVQSGYAYVKL